MSECEEFIRPERFFILPRSSAGELSSKFVVQDSGFNWTASHSRTLRTTQNKDTFIPSGNVKVKLQHNLSQKDIIILFAFVVGLIGLFTGTGIFATSYFEKLSDLRPRAAVIIAVGMCLIALAVLSADDSVEHAG